MANYTPKVFSKLRPNIVSSLAIQSHPQCIVCQW